MQKLALSKAIMDKSDSIKPGSLPQTSLQEFAAPNARYNIPQGVLDEAAQTEQPYLSSIPNTKPVGVPSVDAIKNSKLPDEIKRLMIEHPITQPSMQTSPTLSDDVIEKASKLMKERSNNYVPSSATPKTTQSTSSQIDYNILKQIIRESVEDVLKENGVISESSEKSNELFSFKVGKHIFEGKVTKIKKIQ
jgi:hypothetical protein